MGTVSNIVIYLGVDLTQSSPKGDDRMTNTNAFEPAWQFQHSVDCNAPRQFVWDYWTNIVNWNDPPATFHLDGPFDAGSRLTTSLPGQTLHSLLRDVFPGYEATIEMQLAEAILSFHWMFEALSSHQTQITQRLTLSGANAGAFITQVRLFEQNTPEGMKKLVAAIERSLITEWR